MSLTRSRPPRPSGTPGSNATKAITGSGAVPDFSLPQPLINQPTESFGSRTPESGVLQQREEYREIRCCFSVTIRRDA